MDLQEFLDTSAGNWFTQRTTYKLMESQCNNNKAEITIEKLSSDHPEVISLCEQAGIAVQGNCTGTKISWDNSVDWGQAKEKSSSILVFIPEKNNLDTGKILSLSHGIGAKILLGSYIVAEDESLTLTIEADNHIIEERQWFASPNLRLRSSICRIDNNHAVTSFYSEIRRMGAKN
jgi:hypothetical protein